MSTGAESEYLTTHAESEYLPGGAQAMIIAADTNRPKGSTNLSFEAHVEASVEALEGSARLD